MRLSINRAETHSRGELLLRSFFGAIYIALPHIFVLLFINIWASILNLIAFFVILFTGRFPESTFNFNVGLFRWSARLNASFYNLIDGYPQIGVDGSHQDVTLEIPYPESVSRGKTLLRFFFGWAYVVIPHAFCLYFYAIWVIIQLMIAWWVVLFTGSYPESMFRSIEGYLRWSFRVRLYMGHMTDEYPRFSGNE
jgi:hypothetical protein